MVYELLFTKIAKQDLDETLAYIKTELSNPKAAKDLQGKVLQAIEQIRDFPFSCQLTDNTFLSNEGIRRKTIDNYSLFYLVDENNKRIIVLRLIYSKRNIEDMLII